MKRAVWVAGAALVALSAVPLVEWLSEGGGLPALPSRPYAGRFLILSAFVPYAAALLALRRYPNAGKFIVAVAAACTVLLCVVPPRASQDVFSYLFYGRMWEHGGLNPFVDAPSAFAADPWFAFVRWPDTPSAYGPVLTIVNGGFSALAGSHLWIALALAKILTVAGVALAGVCISKLIGETSRRDIRMAMVLWNPLLLFAVAGDGHIDGLLVGLIAAAVYARTRSRMAVATAALAAAALIKPYAGLFLLLHLGALARAGYARRALQHGAAAAAAAVLAYLPFWSGIDTFSGLRDVASRFSATPARDLRRILDAAGLSASVATGVVRVAGVAAVAAVVVWVIRRRWGAAGAWAAAFAAYLAVTPWFLPWHALPLLVLAAAQGPEEESTVLTSASVALTGASLIAVPAVRLGVPGAAAWLRERIGADRSARITVP